MYYYINLPYDTKCKKITCFSRLAGGVQTIYLYLRAVYIDALLILFRLIFILIFILSYLKYINFRLRWREDVVRKQ